MTADDLVTRALELLESMYVFPDRGARAVGAIRVRLTNGEYADLSEADLAKTLTTQLYDLCADRHLRVRVRDGDLRSALSEAEIRAVYVEQQRLTNHGIARVERLAGNVGYLKLTGVAHPGPGGPAIAAAMTLVSQTYALILDLRENKGGSPDGVIFWCSYLFPSEDTHLNSIYNRLTDTTKQFWTHPYVPGDRYLDRPVYVLTSGVTFSGGEELCYNLQAQGRATLIGETTRGGAHPTQAHPLSPTLEITVPFARSINPVTGTNWEGTGVTPDVAVPATEAFEVAYHRALTHVLATVTAPSIVTEARAALPADHSGQSTPDSQVAGK